MNWRTEWSLHLRAHYLKPNTIAAYERDVEDFVRWFEQSNLAAFEPKFFTRLDVMDYLRNLKKTVAPSTYNRRVASLMVFHQWLKERGLVTLAIEFPRETIQRPAPRWLEADELRRFMRMAEEHINRANTPLRKVTAIRNFAIVALMRYAGLREGEIVALKLSDVEMSERKGEIHVNYGKRGSAVVPMCAELRYAVGMWISQGVGEQLFDVTTRTIQRLVDEIAYDAQICDMTPHRLRHSFVHDLMRRGFAPDQVKELARHANIDQTLQYARPSTAELSALMD
jgi:integrase/recombinase XerC